MLLNLFQPAPGRPVLLPPKAAVCVHCRNGMPPFDIRWHQLTTARHSRKFAVAAAVAINEGM